MKNKIREFIKIINQISELVLFLFLIFALFYGIKNLINEKTESLIYYSVGISLLIYICFWQKDSIVGKLIYKNETKNKESKRLDEIEDFMDQELSEKYTNKDINHILDIVFSSKRSMPAKFYSANGRTQTFDVNYPIPEVDEEVMAGQAWGDLDDYFKIEDYDKNVNDSLQRAFLVMYGENIMLASYIANELNKKNLIPILIQKIYEQMKDTYREKVDIDYFKDKDGFKKWTQYCSSFVSSFIKKD